VSYLTSREHDAKTFRGIVSATPNILGAECDSVSADDGIHYTWKRGPVLVEIDPALDEQGRKDWRVSIWLFRGNRDSDVTEPNLQVWRKTRDLAADYAERKLRQLAKALA
jgi:hypothetical protein